MKIAHVVWGMKTGGVETMLVNIINNHVLTDYLGLFIVNDFIDEPLLMKVSQKCKIVRINRHPASKSVLPLLKLNAKLWQFHPDIVHLHSYQVSRILFGHWNLVRTIHNPGNITDEYPKMKALFAISELVRRDVVERGFPNVVTVHNGIPIKKIAWHRNMTPKDGVYKIVQVSRLYIEQKGQDILLKALGRLLAMGVSNFKLYLIGEGPSRNLLQNLVKELGLDDYVHFEGLKTQEYIFQHLCEYDLFVQPSRYEGFGLSVAEAMAAGLPVLVSDIQGPMEIIGHGKYGMTFKAGDDADLAKKLKTILSGQYDYTLTEKAYQHVCQEYDVETTAQRYLQEYHRVINR